MIILAFIIIMSKSSHVHNLAYLYSYHNNYCNYLNIIKNILYFPWFLKVKHLEGLVISVTSWTDLRTNWTGGCVVSSADLDIETRGKLSLLSGTEPRSPCPSCPLSDTAMSYLDSSYRLHIYIINICPIP